MVDVKWFFHHVQLAEDLTQEVFLHYFEHMPERAGGRTLAYFYTIAGNLCIDEYRKKKEYGSFEELPETDLQDELVETVVLKQALGTLTERVSALLFLLVSVLLYPALIILFLFAGKKIYCGYQVKGRSMLHFYLLFAVVVI